MNVSLRKLIEPMKRHWRLWQRTLGGDRTPPASATPRDPHAVFERLETRILLSFAPGLELESSSELIVSSLTAKPDRSLFATQNFEDQNTNGWTNGSGSGLSGWSVVSGGLGGSSFRLDGAFSGTNNASAVPGRISALPLTIHSQTSV